MTSSRPSAGTFKFSFSSICLVLSDWSHHCNPVQGQYRARTGFSPWSFSHREKPVFITGNPFSHCRDPVFITGNSLWEFVHREIPVVITGNGFAVLSQKRPTLQHWTSINYVSLIGNNKQLLNRNIHVLLFIVNTTNKFSRQMLH